MSWQLQQSPAYQQYLHQTGWKVDQCNDIAVFSKKLPGTPWTMMKIQRFAFDDLDYALLSQLWFERKTMHCLLEPLTYTPKQSIRMDAFGFSQSAHPALPTATSKLSLLRSEEVLLQKMHHKTRYHIKKAQKSDVVLTHNSGEKISQNLIDRSYDLLQMNARRLSLPFSSKHNFTILLRSFGHAAHIHQAYVHDQLCSILVTLSTADTMYYWHNGTTPLGKQTLASYALTWQAICQAKSYGLQWFDFAGIFDDRFPHPRWKGFSRFKRGFGGETFEYPGAFIRWFPTLGS